MLEHALEGPHLTLENLVRLEFLIMPRIFNHAQNFWSTIKNLIKA